MDEQMERIADALANVETQLFALNEWLVRYGQRLEPPVESPGIHLVRVRRLTKEEVKYGGAPFLKGKRGEGGEGEAPGGGGGLGGGGGGG